MSRKESIGRNMARTQSASGPPVTDMVRVAVLPPRLPAGMAPPTRLGAADTFAWDEAINWQHNESIEEQEPGRRKSLMRKVGLTTQRKRLHEDLPPFSMRQVPYDTWRKHYAKDKDGFYRGTHAPAEDCLLRPEDVEKWRFDEIKTKGDQWTRGSHALPVYNEAREHGSAPGYDEDYLPTPEEPTIEPPTYDPAQPKAQRTASTIADGKTAEEIIREAREKAEREKPTTKQRWKQMLSAGVNMTMG